MSFPKYPKYKDSGVEWLGEVPEHWEIVPCRGIVHERTERNERTECVDYLSLMANVGIIPYAEKGDIGNKKPEDLSKCKLVKKGDFVINSMNYGIGSYGVSGYDGICSPVYIVMAPQWQIIEPRFAFRIFEDRAFQKYAQSFGNGILEHRCAINWDILKPIGVPLPPRDEQRIILRFLDGETTKIDELVAEQWRLIELLKEKRQAVISHAVTKGLNPNVPLKPSGIEWLGHVPEQWEVMRLKFAMTMTSGYAFQSEHFVEDGIQVIRIGNLYMNGLCLDRGPVFLPEAFMKRHSEFVVTCGDLLMSLTGTLGKRDYGYAVLLRSNDSFLLNQRVGKLSCGSKIDPDYAEHLLRSDQYVEQICSLPFGTKQANLSNADVLGAIIALPPVGEQREICRYLASETDRLSNLEAEAERSIELLHERRTALISAAVTGKVDVREIVTV